MAKTEEELDAQRQRLEKLRDQIAAEEAKRYGREAEASNTVVAAQLDAEEARLEAELAAAKAAAAPAQIKEGSSALVDTLTDEKKAAEAAAKAAAKAQTTGTEA